jgi:hypothetical protein
MTTNNRPEMVTSTFSTAENPRLIEIFQQQGLLDESIRATITSRELVFLEPSYLSAAIYNFRRNNENNLICNYNEDRSFVSSGNSITSSNGVNQSAIIEINQDTIELSMDQGMANRLRNFEDMPLDIIGQELSYNLRESVAPTRNFYDRQSYVPVRTQEVYLNPTISELQEIRSNRSDWDTGVYSESMDRQLSIARIIGQQNEVQRLEPSYRSQLPRRTQTTSYQVIFRSFADLINLSESELNAIIVNNGWAIQTLNTTL